MRKGSKYNVPCGSGKCIGKMFILHMMIQMRNAKGIVSNQKLRMMGFHVNVFKNNITELIHYHDIHGGNRGDKRGKIIRT
jgi:hypothetical protein